MFIVVPRHRYVSYVLCILRYPTLFAGEYQLCITKGKKYKNQIGMHLNLVHFLLPCNLNNYTRLECENCFGNIIFLLLYAVPFLKIPKIV